MLELVKKFNDFFTTELLYMDTTAQHWSRAFLIKTLRLFYVCAREFTERELTLRAMSLVYTTLLSLVPLVAFIFSILKAFGVHNELEPVLFNLLTPLGDQGHEITQKIMEFVENMKVGILGSIGLGVLIYTVVSLVYKIERSLNHIWKIDKMRSIARRFSDYISTLLLGPLLLFGAIGLTATLKSNAVVQRLVSIEPFGSLLFYLSKLGPYVFVSAAFTFIYIVIPNTKVRPQSALLGGIVAGVLWQTVGWGFASFVVTSTRYTAIYSGFAVLILFMIWLYLSWLILLIGAEISFCHQNLKFLTLKKEAFNLSNRMKEKVSFLVMFLIGYNYYHNLERWTIGTLVERLGLPEGPVQNAIVQLENMDLIIETGDNPATFLPAKDIETIKLKEILDSARTNREEMQSVEKKLFAVQEIDVITERIDESIDDTLGEETLKNVIVSYNKKKSR